MRRREEQKNFTVRDISELVRQGQDLMVQVVKDPLGTKGARLTTDITLPSHLVFMPGAAHVGFPNVLKVKPSVSASNRSWLPIAMSRAVLSFARRRKVCVKRISPLMRPTSSASGPR